MSLLWLLLPLFFCLMRFITHKYICSALITLSCAAVTALAGRGGASWLVVAALVISAGGDWFMSHQPLNPNFFLFGVAGFALAHAVFIVYAAQSFRFSLPALLVALALAVLYAFYLKARVFPKADGFLRPALAGYALISLVGFFFALCRQAPGLEKALYAIGIACILFSDTMIAEARFAGQQWANQWILPTYYLCQLLITASRLLR